MASMPLARWLAGQYYHRGVAAEDLDQVAYLSLVNAVRRFDPSLGYDFATFAIPTIRGELRRHFRDRAWSVKPPRRVQETSILVNRGREALYQELGRSPTVAELADHLGVRQDEVVEAISAAQGCYSTASLDMPVSRHGEVTTLGDLLPDQTEWQTAVEARLVVRRAIAALPPRDRAVLGMRFCGELTQQQIADRLGLSQMQVSRVLSRVLTELRELLTTPEPARPA